MRLVKRDSNGEFSLTDDLADDNIPPYAILSHVWGKPHEEITFSDFNKQSFDNKIGYRKLQFCGEQAARDDLDHFWVDTCCIDKTNNVVLSEAINSMFRWYREAAKCYVYLADVSAQDFKARTWDADFRGSRWFTRGWTLQELLAPASVEFFSCEGIPIGDKTSLEAQIHDITRIATEALQGKPLSDFSVDERMDWAANRKTTRKEDQAYCLLGIFDIYMPLIYGERERALARLREEIDKSLQGNA
jgi:Heterokaryon incompatibility protein (HET)